MGFSDEYLVETKGLKIDLLLGHLKYRAHFPSIYGICTATAYHGVC